MKGFATIFAVLLWSLEAIAFPVTLLWSSPEKPAYLRYVPNLLRSAQSEILVALSDIRAYSDGTTDPLLSALCEAARRGCQVRVLVERSTRSPASAQNEALERLRTAKVEVREDSPEVTLHTKFLVIDSRVVVVGSTHWTKTALTSSVQVDIVVEEPGVAILFREFFLHLWERKLETKTKLPPGPWPGPAVIPLLDFPESNANFTAIRNVLESAKTEVLLLLYELTFYPAYPESPSTLLLGALVNAAKRGVKVRVILESGEIGEELAEENKLSAAWLWAHGVEVRFDANETVMHAKCLIVDRRHVSISSANWNYSSLAKNVEAGVLFWDAPELAELLKAYFLQLWEKCLPLR